MSSDTRISVIIPVSERYDAVAELYHAYQSSLEGYADDREIIYVLDGPFPEVEAQLRALQRLGESIKIVKLARWFGEATALNAGFAQASGEIILTLPAYYQVAPSELPNLLDSLEGHHMAIGRRWPRVDSRFNQLQTRLFHGLFTLISGFTFRDLGCGVRALRRQVIEEVSIYGDQHRFLPLLARQHGFRVKEIDLAQSSRDGFRRIYRPGVYLRRMLDLLAIFFLAKFTRKPLRFFGLLGTGISTVGGAIVLYLVIQRLFLGMPLAERPALLLSSLMVVLGVQLFALGLLGELIIFAHSKENAKEYTIEEVVEAPQPDTRTKDQTESFPAQASHST